MRHQAHGPAGVVIGAQIGVGEVLFFEQNFREAAVGLVALDHQGAGGEGAFFEIDVRRGASHFNALQTQDVDQQRDTGEIFLVYRDDIAVRFFRLTGFDGVEALLIKISEQDLRKRRGQLQPAQDAGLHVVRVVADGPVDLGVGWRGPVPLARRAVAARPGARHFRVVDPAVHGVGAAVAEGLKHAQQPVMIRRHEAQITRGPHIHVAMGPDAGHAVTGHLRHLEVREPGQFAVENGIERRLLRRLAAESIKERHGFMQVVHDGRMPVEIPAQQIAHG